MWMCGSTPQSRSGWPAALDKVEALALRLILAGHRDIINSMTTKYPFRGHEPS
jgi:hypothetical protein